MRNNNDQSEHECTSYAFKLQTRLPISWFYNLEHFNTIVKKNLFILCHLCYNTNIHTSYIHTYIHTKIRSWYTYSHTKCTMGNLASAYFLYEQGVICTKWDKNIKPEALNFKISDLEIFKF